MPGRAGDRPGPLVDGEVIDGEAALDRGLQRLGLDDGLVPGVGDRAAQVPGAVGGIAVPGQRFLLAAITAVCPGGWRLRRPGRAGAVLAGAGPSSGPELACPAPAARNSAATAGSELSSPDALVSFSSVMIPVSGSAARWARYPSRRASGDLRVCRASGSTAEITLSSATFCAIRHRPPVPSLPPAGSTSCPATRASSASAEAAGSSSSAPANASTSAFASLTSAVTSASFAAGSSQSIFGLPGLE